MYRIYRFLKKYLKQIFLLWASFLSATILGNLNNNWENTRKALKDLSNVAINLGILWFVVLVVLAILYYVSKKCCEKSDPGRKFFDIMNEKTFKLLRSDQSGQIEFSWGYNKNIHRCKNPEGWDPSDFWISHYDSARMFSFPKKDQENLIGYNAEAYDEYCSSEKIKDCIENNNNLDRYAVYVINPNFNDKDKKIRIELQKTKWSALQFHWEYMRVLNEKNDPVERTQAVYEEYKKAFLNHPEEVFLINSFCLHLILEDSAGNAVLSRISSNKSNDYSGTWAATIGEQLSLEDFYNEKDNSTYADFVTRWTERALEEEFDISKTDYTFAGENELEDYVDMDSLRVLSIDLEGDIYNIALTATVRLKKTADELKALKGICFDSEELTELKACDLHEIQDILLGYPDNNKEYHPSTYLRLLMFYLHKKGIRQTCADIVSSNQQKRKHAHLKL